MLLDEDSADSEELEVSFHNNILESNSLVLFSEIMLIVRNYNMHDDNLYTDSDMLLDIVLIVRN